MYAVSIRTPNGERRYLVQVGVIRLRLGWRRSRTHAQLFPTTEEAMTTARTMHSRHAAAPPLDLHEVGLRGGRQRWHLIGQNR